MKLVKLSLVAAIAASAFSVANATTVDEVVKDIDVSGVLRYRYDSGSFTGNVFPQQGQVDDRQNHNFRAQLNFQGAIADNFKAFVQFDYSSTDGGYGASSISDTETSPTVRQLYLTYTNDESATSVIAGRQQLNTIWTDNGIDGLVGTGVKVENKSVDGLTIAAFAVDSVDSNDGDFTRLFTQDSNGFQGPLYGTTPGNIYGFALLGSYELGGGTLNPQLWAAYWDNVGGFYAVDAAYTVPFADDVSYTGNFAYLGNSLGKKAMGNGNFFGLKGTLNFSGWDFSLGGLFYGKKGEDTMTTIEDQGNLGSVLAGEEIFYSDGSHLNGDYGQNMFGYLTGGYTFNQVLRLGVDLVYGGTKQGVDGDGAKKFEAVAKADYAYTDKLSFSAFYSYLNENRKELPGSTESNDGHHQAVRLQALYKFN